MAMAMGRGMGMGNQHRLLLLWGAAIYTATIISMLFIRAATNTTIRSIPVAVEAVLRVVGHSITNRLCMLGPGYK